MRQIFGPSRYSSETFKPGDHRWSQNLADYDGKNDISDFFLDPLKGINIDVGLAISMTSQDASKTIQLMQDSIKSIIDTYGTTNLRYSVMTFGDGPKVLVPFAERSPDDLKTIVESVMPSSGTPDLANTLLEAKKLFDGAGARPDAKKILVVIIDSKSGNEKVDIIEAARPLITSGCWIVPVAVAVEDKGTIEECGFLTPLKNTTVEVPKTGNPDGIAKEITDKMKEGKYLFCSYIKTVNIIIGT